MTNAIHGVIIAALILGSFVLGATVVDPDNTPTQAQLAVGAKSAKGVITDTIECYDNLIQCTDLSLDIIHDLQDCQADTGWMPRAKQEG